LTIVVSVCQESGRGLTGYGMLKSCGLVFFLLTLTAFSGCIDNPAASEPPDVYEAEFQLLWDLFDSRYVGFQASGTDWNALYEQFKPQAEDVSSREEMTALTIDLLSNLQDRGITLYDPAWNSEKPYSPPVFTNCSLEVLLDYLSPWGFQWMQEDVWGYCPVGADSVPFFVFVSWDGGMNLSLFDNILFQLQDEPAVILDIRLSQGGQQGPLVNVARRFVDQPRIGFLTQQRLNAQTHDLTTPAAYNLIPRGWHYGGAVVVLAGGLDGASSEMFLSCMSSLPQVTIIGDTTMGSANWPSELWELPDGYHVAVPSQIFLLPDTTMIEGTGILPDIAVEATEEDFTEGVDPVLEYAFQWIGAEPPRVRARR